MGLLDKLRRKKDDDKPKTGKLAVSEGTDVLVDPVNTGEYLPKEGAGGVAAEDNAEKRESESGAVDDSGGAGGAVR